MNTRNVGLALLALIILVAAVVILIPRLVPQDPYASIARPPNLPITGEPPANLPLETTPVPPDEFQPQLAADDMPQILMVQGNQPFIGELEAVGQFVVGDNRIQFVADDGGAPIEILFQLPEGFALQTAGDFEGELTLLDTSSPGTTRRQVTIAAEGQLPLLMEIWRTEPEPQRRDITDVITLGQDAVEPAGEGEYVDSPVYLEVDGERIQDIPVGEGFSIDTPLGLLNVYVEISLLYTPVVPEESEGPGGYILKAWLSGAQ